MVGAGDYNKDKKTIPLGESEMDVRAPQIDEKVTQMYRELSEENQLRVYGYVAFVYLQEAQTIAETRIRLAAIRENAPWH